MGLRRDLSFWNLDRLTSLNNHFYCAIDLQLVIMTSEGTSQAGEHMEGGPLVATEALESAAHFTMSPTGDEADD